MIVLEVDQVEIDYCLECGGIWLDSGELGILLDDDDVVAEFLEKPVMTNIVRESERLCPECEKNLNELLVDPVNGIYIDRCPDRHGLFFDRGELKQVIGLFRTETSKKVASLLKDIFRGDKID
jgi:Zn-finger nucleic acid-binding protein